MEGLSYRETMKVFLQSVMACLLFAASATADEGHSSFWSKTDEWLKKGADFLSKEDRITGLRSLNLTSDEESKRRGKEALETILAEAKKQNVQIFQSGQPEYERVRTIVERVVQASHYKKAADVRFVVVDL